MTRLLVGCCLVVASPLGLDCGDSKSPTRAYSIDEIQGSVDDRVRIGSTKADVRRVLGDYRVPTEPYPAVPLEFAHDHEAAGPYSVVTGPFDGARSVGDPEEVTLRYRGLAFWVRRDRVFAFVVSAKGARTRRDVEVGNRLEAAEQSYPELRCQPDEPTTLGETKAPREAHCEGRLAANRFIWFGGDPIRSITISNAAFFRRPG